MVLSFLFSAVAELGLATLKYTYSIGKYLIYGYELSAEEKLNLIIRQQSEVIVEVKSNLREIKELHVIFEKELHPIETSSPKLILP